MKPFKIDNFKGLLENVDFADKPPQYAENISNLNVDDPVGMLSLRKGSKKKYANEFSNIISSYEYKMPSSGDVILLLNANGTLHWFKNGTYQSDLTLPDGCTIDVNFTNQYFGLDDRIIITTGNGAANYVLWFGYLNRLNSENNGLFGNAEEISDSYKLLKSQMICPNGVFQNVRSIVYDGSQFYYISFRFSIWIEKRNHDFHLVEIIKAHPDLTSITTDEISLCYNSDRLYMGIFGSGAPHGIHKINPIGWDIEVSRTLTGVNDIFFDDNYGYIVNGSTLRQVNHSTLADIATDTTSMAGHRIVGDSITNAAYVILYNASTNRVEKRDVTTIADAQANSAEYILIGSIVVGLHLYGTSIFLAEQSNILELAVSDLTLQNTFTHVDNPTAFISGYNSLEGVVCDDYGIMQKYDTATNPLIYPELIGFMITDHSDTNFPVGTYFYKISIVDEDGQEYTLCDPVRYTRVAASQGFYVNININKDQLDYIYRVNHVNIYRAYNTTEWADKPETDYRFVETIDINDSNWTEKSTQGIYYYSYKDTTLESEISDVTFKENSGIGDTVKPRFVNYKYQMFLDNQLHIVNFSHDGDDYLNKIIRSPALQPDNIALYDYYDYGGKGHEILGLIHAYGRSIIFKRNSVGVFYNEVLEFERTPGISSDKGYCENKDEIFYEHESGIYRIHGNSHDLISEPVADSFADITDKTNGVLFYRDNKNRLIISHDGGITLVYNTKYKLWTKYSNAASFRGLFLNTSNEYIGISSGSFYIITGNTDHADVSGANGVRIGIDYDSGLIRLTSLTGMMVDIYQLEHRLNLITSSNVNFILRRIKDTGPLNISNYNITPQAGNYAVNKTHNPQSAYGEAFDWHLGGEAQTLNYNSLMFLFEVIGLVENV
jgi:hypothetical protein